MFSSKSPKRQKRDEKSEAELLSATLPPLQLRAEKLARGFDPGVHGRRKAGVGEDFWQFSHYSTDSPASKIDWRQSAKRDQLFVRQKELETAESVWFWVDSTLNMTYKSHLAEHSKLFNARVMSLALSLLLTSSGENFGLLGISDRATHGPVAFDRFSQDLITKHADILTDAPSQLRLPTNTRVVLMSDFLTPLDKLEKLIRSLSQNRCRGILVHFADPAEITLPFTGRNRFEGMQRELPLTIGRTEAVQLEYQSLFSNHRLAVNSLAKQGAWDYLFVQTNEPQGDAFANLYQFLQRRA